MEAENPDRKVLAPDPLKAYWVVAWVCFLVLCAIYMGAFISPGPYSHLDLPAGIFVLIFWYIAKLLADRTPEVTADEHGVHYRPWWGKPFTLPWKSIGSTHFITIPSIGWNGREYAILQDSTGRELLRVQLNTGRKKTALLKGYLEACSPKSETWQPRFVQVDRGMRGCTVPVMVIFTFAVYGSDLFKEITFFPFLAVTTAGIFGLVYYRNSGQPALLANDSGVRVSDYEGLRVRFSRWEEIYAWYWIHKLNSRGKSQGYKLIAYDGAGKELLSVNSQSYDGECVRSLSLFVEMLSSKPCGRQLLSRSYDAVEIMPPDASRLTVEPAPGLQENAPPQFAREYELMESEPEGNGNFFAFGIAIVGLCVLAYSDGVGWFRWGFSLFAPVLGAAIAGIGMYLAFTSFGPQVRTGPRGISYRHWYGKMAEIPWEAIKACHLVDVPESSFWPLRSHIALHGYSGHILLRVRPDSGNRKQDAFFRERLAEFITFRLTQLPPQRL